MDLVKAFNVKRRTRHKIVSAVASFMLIGLAFTQGITPAHAIYINNVEDPSLLSNYSPFIDWVDWSERDPDKQGAQFANPPKLNAGGAAARIPAGRPYHTKSVRQVGDSQLITRCTAKTVFSDRNSDLTFHAPGGYGKDPFDDFYGKHHLVGIGRGDSGQSTIDVSCNVVLKRGAEETPIPIQGLVFADGESTNRRRTLNGDGEPTFYRREFFEMTPHVPAGHEFDWKLLEYKPGDDQCKPSRDDLYQGQLEIRRGRDTGKYRMYRYHGRIYDKTKRSSLNDGGLRTNDNLRVRGFGGPCGAGKLGRQPLVNVFAEGADGAYLDLYGAGGNYVAVGIVLGVDFGDAIATYPKAGAVVTPHIEKGSIPTVQYGDISGGKRKFDDLDGEDNPRRHDRTKVRQQDFAENVLKELKRNDNAARITYDKAPYIGLNGPDSDLTADEDKNVTPEQKLNFISDDMSEDGAGDGSVHGTEVREEDALADQDHPNRKSLLVYANADTNYELEVPCKAASGKDTFVEGWLDWNGNGDFSDDGEAAKAVCPSGDRQKVNLHWNVTAPMLPTDPLTRSAIRLRATTNENASFTGVTTDGEVEDHTVTLVRPQLTLNKQFVNGDGQPDNDNKTSLLTGWQFTANEANDYVLTGDGNIQNATTDASGNAILKFKQTSPSPEYLPLDARDATSYPGKDLTLTETPNYHYRLADFEAVNCTPAEKPADWSLMNNPDSYPWPEADVPTIKSSDGVLTVHNFSATSVATCQVNNKPDGVLKITPQVEFKDKTITPAPTIDTSLTFSGTWQCEAQVSGKTVTVDGTWGPVAAGTSWVFTPSQDNDYKRIPFGASCSVQQNSESTANDVKSQRPVKTGDDAKLYRWDTVSYAPTGSISAGNSAITGSQDAEFVVTNQVVKKSKASVSWKKTDELNRVLQGAEFKLTRTTAGFTPLTVTDCVAADATQCAAETDKDPVAGQFKVEDIPQGTGYQLTETKAPVGYKKLEDPTGFDVTQDDLLKDDGKVLADIINHPYPLNELPFLPITGGTATDIFLILGGVIGAMSLTLAIAAKRRNNQSRS